MPRGVPADIAATFRAASGRTYRAGQYLSYRSALILYDLVQTWQDEQEALGEEWEVGIDYTESEGYPHKRKQGLSADVSMNARIFREDGAALSADDAVDALAHIADTGTLPPGIGAHTVQWARWRGTRGHRRHGSWREGDEGDLAAFQQILTRMGRNGIKVRLGKAKPTEVLPDTLVDWVEQFG